MGLFKKQTIRAIAENADCGNATVLRTKQTLEENGISLKEAIAMDDNALESLFGKGRRKPEEFAEEDFAEVLKKNVSAKYPLTLTACWESYRKNAVGDTPLMSYKTYCKRFRQYKQRVDQASRDLISGRHVWPAGYAAMIDYSGDGLTALIDGKEKELQIFVAVLPFSGYSFAWATPAQTRKSWFHAIRAFLSYLGSAPKYLILDNSTTCVTKASKTLPKYAREFKQFCDYYGVMPYAGEPGIPLSKPHVERAVGLVQQKVLSVLTRQRMATSLKEANERLRTLMWQFNASPLSIDPSESRTSIFESAEKAFLNPIPAIPWGEDVCFKRLKVQSNGTVRYSRRRYRVDYRHVGSLVNVVALGDEETLRFYTNKTWQFICELPLRDGKNMTIDRVDLQHPHSRYMQKDARELGIRFRRSGEQGELLYKQLVDMKDELQAARYARFLVKMLLKLGTAEFEKSLENTPKSNGIWDLQLLEARLRRDAVLLAADIKQGAGKRIQVELNLSSENLRGAEHFQNLSDNQLKEKKND